MQKFIIDRSTWLRGSLAYPDKRYNRSYLLRASDNRKCCLGFVCLQSGYTKNEIWNVRGPMTLQWHNNKTFWNFAFPPGETIDTDAAIVINEIMDVNDDPKINDEQRESQLKELALKLDWELEFIN